MDLEQGIIIEQWFTLFDYLEDDLFDGVLGENDSETPMVQLRYFTSTDLHASSTSKTTTQVVTSSGSPTKTVVTTTTYTTKTSTATSENSEAYSVRTLTKDLRNELDSSKGELQADQSEIHAYEDKRSDTLAHLENVHKELEKEHINDQVRGAEVDRLNVEVASEINIAKSQFDDEKASLGRQIDHIDAQAKEQDPILAEKQGEHKSLTAIIGENEKIEQGNLSQAATDLRKDNAELRNKMTASTKNVKKERDGKVKVFNEHADLVTKYSELVIKYEELLSKVELERKDIDTESISTSDEFSKESAHGVNLTHQLNCSVKNSQVSSDLSNSLKKDLEGLKKHYAGFESMLTKFISNQNSEISKLEGDLKTQVDGISRLQGELSETANKIVEIHAVVDKENAANLNFKLSLLIGNLINADKYRKEAQGKLENAQEGWTAKLKLFEDEASRMSRESANQKWTVEVENLINKLDKLNRDKNEIARQRDEFDLKVTTDINRDHLIDNLAKEKEKLTLKNRWINDELDKTRNDLSDLLKFLEFKKGFLDDQEEQLKTLRFEIEEIRVKITE